MESALCTQYGKRCFYELQSKQFQTHLDVSKTIFCSHLVLCALITIIPFIEIYLRYWLPYYDSCLYYFPMGGDSNTSHFPLKCSFCDPIHLAIVLMPECLLWNSSSSRDSCLRDRFFSGFLLFHLICIQMENVNEILNKKLRPQCINGYRTPPFPLHWAVISGIRVKYGSHTPPFPSPLESGW